MIKWEGCLTVALLRPPTGRSNLAPGSRIKLGLLPTKLFHSYLILEIR